MVLVFRSFVCFFIVFTLYVQMSITYTVDVELGLEDSTGPVVDNLEISGASCPRESLALDVVDKHGVERGIV